MDILKSKKEVLHRFFMLLANTKSQAMSFVAYDWTTRPSIKFVLYDPRYLLEYTMLPITVCLRMMEPTDFVSILAM